MADDEKGRTAPMRPREIWKTRRAALVAACLSLALVAFGCAKREARPEVFGTPRITPAMHNDMPGLSYKTGYRRSGFEVHLLNHIEEWLKVPMTGPDDVPSGDRVPLLRSGKADMVVAAFSITTDRMQKIDFIGPYVTTRQGFLVGKKGPRIGTRDDLRGTTVCTWDGTTSAEQLRKLHMEPLVLQDAASCVKELRAGRVDAVSTDQMILYGLAERYAADGLRVVPNLVIGAPQHYGIGVRKGHREDCERLREYVKGYVGSSEWVNDIRSSLPKLVEAEPEWTNSYKPSDQAIDARSCRDKPSP